VRTARVRAPAACPDLMPEGASSTTRPINEMSHTQSPCKVRVKRWRQMGAGDYIERDKHFVASTPHFLAPARYGSGCGFPLGTSFAVTYPASRIGTEHFFRALGAYTVCSILSEGRGKGI